MFKKINVFEVLIFWRHYCQFQDVEALSLYDIFLGNFTLSNLIILVGYLIKWNRGFEIFSIDHHASEIWK